MSSKIFILFSCVILTIVEASSSYDDSSNDTTANPERMVIRLQKDQEDEFIKDSYDCVDNFRDVPCFLKFIRSVKIRYDKPFKDFIFCTYNKFGLVDEKTGQVNENKYLSMYPKECNATSTFMKCGSFNGINPVETCLEFFVCDKMYNPCLINFLPPGM